MPGIGVDIVDINRIKRIIKSDDGAFLRRVFTRKEISNSARFPQKAEYFSRLFSFKESFAKAKGRGFSASLRPSDIELEIPVESGGNLSVQTARAYFKRRKIKGIYFLNFLKFRNNIICRLVLDNRLA